MSANCNMLITGPGTKQGCSTTFCSSWQKGFQSQVYQAADCCPGVQYQVVLIITSHPPSYMKPIMNVWSRYYNQPCILFSYTIHYPPCNILLIDTYVVVSTQVSYEGEEIEKLHGPLPYTEYAPYYIWDIMGYIWAISCYHHQLLHIPLDDFSSIQRRLTSGIYVFIIGTDNYSGSLQNFLLQSIILLLNPKFGSSFNFRQLGDAHAMHLIRWSWKRQNDAQLFTSSCLGSGERRSEEVMMRSLGNQITGNSTLLITCRDTSYIRQVLK